MASVLRVSKKLGSSMLDMFEMNLYFIHRWVVLEVVFGYSGGACYVTGSEPGFLWVVPGLE